MDVTALVLAAGAGTRMKSSKPKVAFEMLGKPLIRWVVDAARQAGCRDVIAVLGHGRELVEPLVPDVAIAVQEQLLGTGHAVLMAKDQLSSRTGSVVVLSGDSPMVRPQTIASLCNMQHDQAASAVVLTSIQQDPFGYGRIVRDDDGNVLGIVEQKDCTPQQAQIRECNSGMYCFDIAALLDCLARLGNDNAQGEYYLTDVVGLMVQGGLKVAAMPADDPAETMGINDRVQLSQATRQMQQRINHQLMLQGVTMMDPSQVWVGPDVQVGQDVELLPLTMLMGNTSVGEGSIVGPNTRITNSTIGRNCVVDESVVIDSVFDDGVNCGPRAYIRPGVHMCEGSKAGTHVEIKKSTIGRGSKVPHLSYIGDTQMGAGVNVGAGSITCNYDGTSKHPTTIGDNTFIGSDTMMVAPVTIGDDVLVAAGSVITTDVPDGSLAAARAKQRNILGYSKHKARKRSDDKDGK